jgi:hypothetical protein
MLNGSKYLRNSLLGLLIVLPNLSNAQSLDQDTLGGDTYYLDMVGNGESGKKNTIYILQVLPKSDGYRMIRALYCKDSSLAFKSYTTPESCVIWTHDDNPRDKVTKVDHGKTTRLNKNDLPDSTKSIDKECLNNFYSKTNDSIRVDTIYVEKNNLAYTSLFYSSKCSYVNGLKHGAEVLYYEPWELKGECITNYKRVKLVASWLKGKETGEWLYYDVNGRLIKKETYKKGKLKEVAK